MKDLSSVNDSVLRKMFWGSSILSLVTATIAFNVWFFAAETISGLQSMALTIVMLFLGLLYFCFNIRSFFSPKLWIINLISGLVILLFFYGTAGIKSMSNDLESVIFRELFWIHFFAYLPLILIVVNSLVLFFFRDLYRDWKICCTESNKRFSMTDNLDIRGLKTMCRYSSMLTIFKSLLVIGLAILLTTLSFEDNVNSLAILIIILLPLLLLLLVIYFIKWLLLVRKLNLPLFYTAQYLRQEIKKAGK